MTLYSHSSVRALPLHEQPTGRLYHVGPQAMSLVELLAVLIGGPQQLDVAQQLVVTYGDRLSQALTAELQNVAGVGPQIAARIQAAVELGRRFAQPMASERPAMNNPGAAAAYLQPLIGDLEQEHFAVLLLDTRCRALDHEILYKGCLNTTIVRTAEVFRGAIRRNCASVIVAHNHPSGDPSPSPEDVALTRRLVEAGKLMEVEVIDHLVIGRGCYVSLRERGLGFTH